MSKYEDLRDQALLSLRTYMDSLDEKKGTILAYWVNDYVKFLSKEATFDPKNLIRYKRGSIVKVHLGYRIGSEEGGLHYAVVIDVNNSLSSSTATVIPLTSVKPGTDIGRLHTSKIFLYDELFKLLQQKINDEIADALALRDNLLESISDATQRITGEMGDEKAQAEMQRIVIDGIIKRADQLNAKIAHCEKLQNEILKMKRGSIALVGQITTVSKIRIYDPLYPSDALANIRLSDATMDRLDQKVKELFTKPISSAKRRPTERNFY